MRSQNKLRQIVTKLKALQPVDSTMVNALYTLSQRSLVTAIVFVILVSIFLYSQLTYGICLWGSVLVTFLVYRLYQAYLYKTAPQMHAVEIWHKKFMIHAFVTGFLVSILGFVFIHYLNAYYQIFVIAALLGLTAGATASLSSDVRIGIIYISLISLPLIISLLLMNRFSPFILATLLTLFYLSQVLMILKNYTQNLDMQELKVQKNLLHNLFSEAPLGMFSYDKYLNILDANKQVCTIFEPQNKITAGMDLLYALPDTDLQVMFSNTLTDGPQSYAGSYVSLNGNAFWIEATGFPFRGENNKIIGGIGIIDDKTQEHAAQKELEALSEKLQKQIENNQYLLDENRQFIADMVHQIRTPLTVIMTNASLIEMQSELAVSPYVMQINSAINMLSNAYEDLSYVISNDTMDYKPVDIDLSHFLQERITFFELIVQANHKTILALIAENIHISMNDTELERLIDNSLSNAIKHSYDDSEIKVVLEKDDPDIVLKFISKGNTIKDVTKIFDKNYTENHHAKRSLGLGLHMVKAICEKNHIRYSVHSEDNINTFTYIFAC